MNSYQKATKASTGNPTCALEFDRNATDIVRIPLKFQPLGITQCGGQIAIADYFGPSVLLCDVVVTEESVTLKTGEWVRGVVGWTRMFPDIHHQAGANRMQTALLDATGRMGLVRNFDNSIYWVEKNPLGWFPDHNVVKLSMPEGDGFIHSLVVDEGSDGLLVVRPPCLRGTCSDLHAQNWFSVLWNEKGEMLAGRVAPFRYGIACRKDGSIVTITDSRSEEPHGIYVDDNLAVPDIVGNGIVLLEDGKAGALVTRYTYEQSLNVPPELIYVPPSVLRF